MLQEFEIYLNSYLQGLPHSSRQGLRVLHESLSYSLKNGGKRFRPKLVFTMANSYLLPHQQVLPWALAVEFIHSYSLIHDDLPCMDNDDFRRGQPTNHKMYGEDIALLAGDALLTESFRALSSSSLKPLIIQRLIQLLSENAGILGMVGGQAIDLRAEKNISIEQLMQLHAMKTGALIQAAVLGAGIIAERGESELKSLAHVGLEIGLCFQIKDDLLDRHQVNEAQKNYVFQIGADETAKLLQTKTEALIRLVNEILPKPDSMTELIEYNLKRDQ